MVKVCLTCLEVKDEKEFIYNRLKCKQCYRKEANARYHRNKAQKKEKKDSTATRSHKENKILKEEVERLKKLLDQMVTSSSSVQTYNIENKYDNMKA